MFAPISKAQTNGNYILSVKGDKVPFDSAVVIKIDQYRKESQFIKRQDQLIESLNAEVQENKRLLIQSSRILDTNQTIMVSMQQSSREKDLLLKTQNDLVQRLKQELTKPLPFYNSPIVMGGLGILVGVLINE